MAPVCPRPGVYVEEAPTVAAIKGVDTSITVFIGWTPKGPMDQPLHIISWSEYERSYGSLDPDSLVSYAIHFFFVNGGRQAYVIRLAESSTISLPTSAPSISAPGASRPGPQRIVAKRVLSSPVLRPNAPGFVDKLRAAFPQIRGIELFSIICVPGLADIGTLKDLQALCLERRAFLIIDCPEDAALQTVGGSDLGELARSTGSSNSAFYFPWAEARDPRSPQASKMLPPSCFVPGIISRVDVAKGVWKAPAGVDAGLIGAIGVRVDIDGRALDDLNAKGIACLRDLPGAGTVIWGSRTLQSGASPTSEWKYIPVRRTALFIEESVLRGTRWAVFEPNAEPLWAKVRSTITEFMTSLFRNGAFQGRTPQESFFVKCGRETMTQADIDHGVVNITIGFAMLRPGEFIVIRMQQRP